jgi:hypothetical protein
MALIIYQYIMPGLKDINQLTADAQSAIDSYSQTNNEGIEETRLTQLI